MDSAIVPKHGSDTSEPQAPPSEADLGKNSQISRLSRRRNRHGRPKHKNTDGSDLSVTTPAKVPSGTSHGKYMSSLPAHGPTAVVGTSSLHSKRGCKVRNRRVDNAGATDIQGTSKALKGLSWTDAVAQDENGDGTDVLHSFYLGAPTRLNLTDVSGCALFFGNTSAEVAFSGDEVKGPHGTCDWALNQKCVDGMLKQAKAVNATGSEADTCTALQRSFEDSVNSECKDFARGNWTDLLVKPMSSIERYNATTRKRSSCWPAKNQKDNLNLVSTIKDEISDSSETDQISLATYRVMPILTFFFPGNGSLITDSEAHMTCIKPIGEVQKRASDDDSGAARLAMSGPDLAGMLLCLWLFVSLFGGRRL